MLKSSSGGLRRAAWVQLVALLLTVIVPSVQIGAATAPPIPLDPAFAAFVSGVGADILGAPITPVILRDGKRYQYLERGRLDAPITNGDNAVQLANAGTVLSSGRDFAPLTTSTVNADTRYFPETRHSLAYAFRAFWESKGGQKVFGLPISEEFIELNPDDGRIYTVQYFERFRFERHPEFAGTPREVQLGLLGKQLYQFYEGVRLPSENIPVKGMNTPRSPAFGIVTEFTNQPRDRIAYYVRDLGFKWVRQPLQWAGLETQRGMYDFAGLDLVVTDLQLQGCSILFTISGTPTWYTANGDNGAPRDPQDFARFMSALTKHYAGRVAAYEIWNEPNIAVEWGPRIDAGAYVEMVKAVSPVIRANDPNALIVGAALGPTGYNDPKIGIDDVRYLERLEAYEGGIYRTLTDVQGVHPYGYRNAPDTLWPDQPNSGEYTTHASFYFRRIEQMRLAMIRAGDGGRAMWVTEWGYGSGDFPEFNDVSEETRTQWTLQTISMMQTRYPWVGAMFLWNLNWSVISPKNVSWGYFSLLDDQYRGRPLYYVLKNMQK